MTPTQFEDELDQLRNIRMVCYALNDTVQARVLEEIELPGNIDKVRDMARGRNGFCEAARVLHLGGISPDRTSSNKVAELRRAPYDPVMHKAQSKYLCAAILTLRNITTVRFVAFLRF